MKWTGEWCTRGVCLSQLWVLIRLTVYDRAAESVCLCVCVYLCVCLKFYKKTRLYGCITGKMTLERNLLSPAFRESWVTAEHTWLIQLWAGKVQRILRNCSLCSKLGVCVAHPVINWMKHQYEGIKVCLCVPGFPLCLPTTTCVRVVRPVLELPSQTWSAATNPVCEWIGHCNPFHNK